MERLADAFAVELRLPAQERMMLVIRLTTSGVLSRTGLTLDALDDVKMAVEEAAGCLIRFSGCADLVIGYTMDTEQLRVSLRGEAIGRPAERPAPDEMLAIRCILESMADEVRIREDGPVLAGIELTKRLPD